MKEKTRENKKQKMLEINLTTRLKNSREQFRTQNGITLIALVVTIVVLLILAGVSISLVLGNNGIITKAQESKVVTRAGAVEDEVALWKTDNYLAENTNGTAETDAQMIARLQTNKLITEDDEVDTENKIIKIKKSNGTIVKEISYGINAGKQVKINISKTPETGDAPVVKLQVSSVEGIKIKIETDEDYDTIMNLINELNAETKKDLYKQLKIRYWNEYEEKNFTNFSEALQYMNENVWYYRYDSEEHWWDENWDWLDEEGKNWKIMDEYEDDLYYDYDTEEYSIYMIINPDNEISDTYIAMKNGSYTFKMKDLITNETYSKTIEVTNIKDVDYGDYKVEYWLNRVVLLDKSNDNKTTFEQVYMIYNDEVIDITHKIQPYFSSSIIERRDIDVYLMEIGKITSERDILNTTQEFIIAKDGEWYRGKLFLEDIEM